MIRNEEIMNEIERLRQAERPSAPLHLVVHGRRIVGTEQAKPPLSIPVSTFSTLLASRESFITDWADS
jgi:hypothetical protein